MFLWMHQEVKRQWNVIIRQGEAAKEVLCWKLKWMWLLVVGVTDVMVGPEGCLWGVSSWGAQGWKHAHCHCRRCSVKHGRNPVLLESRGSWLMGSGKLAGNRSEVLKVSTQSYSVTETAGEFLSQMRSNYPSQTLQLSCLSWCHSLVNWNSR